MIENNDDECNYNYDWFYLKQISGQSSAYITTCLAMKRPELLIATEEETEKWFQNYRK